MKNIENMTPEERRTEIAYKRQALQQLYGNIPEKQFKEQQELFNKQIKELGGKDP